jgi:hypothetical protein
LYAKTYPLDGLLLVSNSVKHYQPLSLFFAYRLLFENVEERKISS